MDKLMKIEYSKFKFLTKNKYNIDFSKILKLITKAGTICLNYQKNIKNIKFEYKSKNDIVTEADKKVEYFIISNILKLYPTHSFFGEETKNKFLSDSEFLWIIDPIDGTNSFLHNQIHYGISLALQYKNEMIFGCVYSPRLTDMYFSVKKFGSFKNNIRIQVSSTKKLENSALSTGFAASIRGDNPDYTVIDVYKKILNHIRSIRQYGTAALHLCYTAEGILDGFWEKNLNIYDIAAGSLILQEAGGKVTDYKNKNNYTKEKEIVGTNSYIHKELLSQLKNS